MLRYELYMHFLFAEKVFYDICDLGNAHVPLSNTKTNSKSNCVKLCLIMTLFHLSETIIRLLK